MRTALVHDWFLTVGGAERVLEQMALMYPDAPIYFVIMDPKVLPPAIASHPLHQTWIHRLPRARRWYKRYLPIMPWAVEDLDLSSYDLVLSDCSAVAKGVLTGTHTLHVSYIHTPTRYLWDMYHDYRRDEAGALGRLAVSPLFSFLRRWDRVAADRPDVLIANSYAVKRRIEKHYRRDSVVVHPPVDVDRFEPGAGRGDYYLVLSRLVPYKRFDLAVEACTRLRVPLVVAGEGPDLPRLRRLAGPTVRFVGRPDNREVVRLMQNARGLLFPGEEDFGIVLVEIQAAGRPALAFARGGARDTVIPGETGLLIPEQTVDAVIDAIESAERMAWDPARIRANAERFRPEAFRTRYRAVIQEAWDRFQEAES
jgi:glycosyltransferase involved in cell wall biosynthesis